MPFKRTDVTMAYEGGILGGAGSKDSDLCRGPLGRGMLQRLELAQDAVDFFLRCDGKLRLHVEAPVLGRLGRAVNAAIVGLFLIEPDRAELLQLGQGLD